jgi:hypothetical protein
MILCIKHVATTKLFFTVFGVSNAASYTMQHKLALDAFEEWRKLKKLSRDEIKGYTWSVYRHVFSEHTHQGDDDGH